MKIKSLLFVALAVAVLTGCVKENETPDVVTPIGDGNAKVTLSISQAAPAAKAYSGTEVATGPETAIVENDGLVVFAFNAEGRQLLTYSDLVLIETVDAATKVATSKSFPVPEGGTYFYVFTNVASALGDNSVLLSLASENTSRAEFEQKFLETTTINGLGILAGNLSKTTNDGSFLMGTLWGNDSDNLESVAITDTGDPQEIELEVGRLVSKVTVNGNSYADLTAVFTAASADDLKTAGTWEDVSWKIINVPEKMHVAGNWKGAKPGAKGISQVVTPFFDESAMLNKYNNHGGGVGKSFNFKSDWSLYTIENTHKAPLNGNTTAAHFMGTFMPVKVLSAENGSDVTSSYSKGNDFWAVPSSSSGNGYTFYNGDPYDKFGIEGAVHYPGAKVHYIVYIQDTDESVTPMRYAVLRNHSYKLNITSVNWLGIRGGGQEVGDNGEPMLGSVPEVPDPKDPRYPDPITPVDEDPLITVTITVLDWYKVTEQGVEF